MNGNARTNVGGKIWRQRLARERWMSNHRMAARYGSIMKLTERLRPTTFAIACVDIADSCLRLNATGAALRVAEKNRRRPAPARELIRPPQR
jgi:hypothetical protein